MEVDHLEYSIRRGAQMKKLKPRYWIFILMVSNATLILLLLYSVQVNNEMRSSNEKQVINLSKTIDLKNEEIKNKENELNQKSILLEQSERTLSEKSIIEATLLLLINEKILDNSLPIALLDTVNVGIVPHRFNEPEMQYRIVSKGLKLRFGPLFSSAVSYIMEEDFKTKVIDSVVIESSSYRENWIYVEVKTKDEFIEKGWIPLKSTTEYNENTKYQVKNVKINKGTIMYETELPEITRNKSISSVDDLECMIIRESGDFVLINPFFR